MQHLDDARLILQDLDLAPGLASDEVERRLQIGQRLGDTGQRVLAYYLVEVADRSLHTAFGCPTVAVFAERLGLDERRTRELIAVGRALLDLPSIDAAFCRQAIGGSKVLELVKVATPVNEALWVQRAAEVPIRELRRQVKTHRRGDDPRTSGRGKAVPVSRFAVRAQVDPAEWAALDQAQKKLAAELDRPVSMAECMATCAELFLQWEQTGRLPGRKRVDASLYRIVLHQPEDDAEGKGPLDVQTDDGPLPTAVSESARCDGTIDGKTSETLRRKVLDRDRHRCRCCGRRVRLHVHHVEPREQGGPTKAWNLLSLCVECHGLVHDGLLILDGKRQERVCFRDVEGRDLRGPEGVVGPRTLLALRAPPPAAVEPARLPAPADPLDALPEDVDRAWWRANGHLLRMRASTGVEVMPGEQVAPQEMASGGAANVRRPPADGVFEGLVGMDRTLRNLEVTAAARHERGEPFPHTLFSGPPGTGKTTLAQGVARILHKPLQRATGGNLPDAYALLRLLAGLQEGDVLFIDEVHGMPPKMQETLYEALAEGQVSFTVHAGVRERTVRLTLVRREATGRGLAMEAQTAHRIARCARGTPREVQHLVAAVHDEACFRGVTRVDDAVALAGLERAGFDEEGLDVLDRAYLAVVRSEAEPTPLTRIAGRLRTTPERIARAVEPLMFQRGLVRMTPRGRVAV